MRTCGSAKCAGALLALAALLVAAPCGCSSSSPAGDATPVKDTPGVVDRAGGDARGDGAQPLDHALGGEGARGDRGVQLDKRPVDLPPKADKLAADQGLKADKPPVGPTWSVAATRPELLMNTTLATHPTQPKTIAVKLEVLAFMPILQVVTSDTLGASISTATLKSFSGNMVSEMPKGFAYDPGNGKQLALLSQMIGLTGPPQDSLVFATSTSGGLGFTLPTLSTNPFPPDGMKFVGGAKSELFVRAQHVLQSSPNLGATWTTIFQDSSKCLAHGDFSVNAADHGTFILTCYAALLRCENKSVCANAQLPAGITDINRVEISPTNGQRVLAAADNGQVLLSTDGGKTFTATLKLSAGALVTRLLHDPRPTADAMYVYRPAIPELYRSTDKGQSWQNVSPAGTYLRDVGVASDGTVIGLGNPGVITLAAP